MTFLKLHRWTARLAVLQAVIYSICYTVEFFEPGSGGEAAYAVSVAEPFYVCSLCCRFMFGFVLCFCWITRHISKGKRKTGKLSI